ncbi:uncharacterized protein At4g10930 isoform X2 [Ricinus communis]|uniref:uncharacterized protein At4g10930 isoform X2 n=2 Tax=Ricinus communis TaxID=3988 RepID=UPI00201AB1DD|nr:uncharacterized protein At4g10930 isoform X2 [Ricinus communis]
MIMEVDFVTSDIVQEETIDADNDYSNFEGERCGICMDIVFDRGVLDCCQHWFCFTCIDNWATITNLCPLCQNEFQLITCVPVYDTIGSNKVDDDSFSRDDDWCVEGKNNTLSFPSYYIDENAVICLDGDECKIRSGSANMEEDSNLDTSIACDSCDIWYHAFCVGFDPEGTSEDTWLCPRCVAGKVPQKFDATSIQRPTKQCGAESCYTSSLPEATFSGKLSVSVADAGETAVVVSMVDEDKRSEEASEKFCSVLEVDKNLNFDAVDGNSLKEETPSGEKNEIQPIMEGQGLELSLSHDTSLVLSELKSSCADSAVNPPNSNDDVNSCLRKLLNDSNAGNKLSESETSIGLHLGLSVSSFLSVNHMKNNGTEDQGAGDIEQKNLAEEPLLREEKILCDANEEAVKMIGLKRTQMDRSFHGLRITADKEDNAKDEDAAPEKKIRTKGKFQMESMDQFNKLLRDDSHICPAQVAVSKDVKSKKSPEKEDVCSDIMRIVKSIRRRPSRGLANQSSVDKSSKERESAAGLRVKKIMRRDTKDKESSSVVQKLRTEIREAVRKKASVDIGESLFDPKLLAAFRTAVAGATTEAIEKLPPSALKAKKSLLQKGKIRESLTKKIYGNTNGRRKRAWDRECEVEFWKHRCMRATKPEKIATLKSVLNLLRKNPEGPEIEQASQSQVANPILSRLYLADTSVFPRKDDIKPLSALKAASDSEQSRGQHISIEKGQNPSLDDRTQKVSETNKVSSKLSAPSVHDKAPKDKVPVLKYKAASSKAHPDKASNGSLQALLGGSKVNSLKETGSQSDDKKLDKRKWALEVLARKKAATGTVAMQEKQEDNAILKGYPLLAQLPIDMRPVLAPSRHNKVPVSVRQTQLYRLTEHFLRKANLPEIRRTAETELAVADAINIEKEVADKSNSKLVYLNLCSQEILRRSDNSESIRAKLSNPSPIPLQPVDQSEQASEIQTDSAIRDALKNAGLLSDSPPSSPRHNKETSNEVGNPSIQNNEEGPDNILEIDSQPEVDIYGDFDYDLEDEDYIGAAAIKVPKAPPEETESRMKVVFSTLKHESIIDVQKFEDSNRSEDIKELKHSPSQQKGHIDAEIIGSIKEGGNDSSCFPPATLLCEEGMEPSLAECEELYGPDKEPLMHKYPEDASKELDGLFYAEASDEKKVSGQVKPTSVASSGQTSCNGENSSNLSGTSENIPRKDIPKIEANRQCDAMNSVSKKVETYIKEHIRPLCKSGIITAEQYRWAVAKTSDKVMKYHLNAKNANFLIKEGEKVKKLAEQYVETAQQKEKSDML